MRRMSHLSSPLPLALVFAAAVLLVPLAAGAQGGVKIGVLTDMNSAYRDIGGAGSVLAARMAINDFGGSVLGQPVELVSADHENSPATAERIANEWMTTDDVDLVVDVPNSNAAVLVARAAARHKRIVIVSSAGTTRLTNEECTPYSFHWTYDTSAVTGPTARAIMAQGGNSWFFVTADYLFGESLEAATKEVIKAGGGTVLGSARHPFPSNTYRTLKAQARSILKAHDSEARVIALASTGTDAINAIKNASRFGITSRQTLAALSLFISDVAAVGLYDAQGLYLTTGFYWDLNDETRAWSRRFFQQHQQMPTMVHAGVYSAVTHYLKAVRAAGSTSASAVAAAMRARPVDDFFARKGVVREDGRMVHDMFLVQVKAPAESRYPWDFYHVRQVIPGEVAFQLRSANKCPLLKRREQ